VVVHDLYIPGASFGPDEADPELVVDPNAMLAFPISPESLETVAWRNPEVFQGVSLVQLVQLPPGHLPEIGRACLGRRLGTVVVEDISRAPVLEGLDHGVL